MGHLWRMVTVGLHWYPACGTDLEPIFWHAPGMLEGAEWSFATPYPALPSVASTVFVFNDTWGKLLEAAPGDYCHYRDRPDLRLELLEIIPFSGEIGGAVFTLKCSWDEGEITVLFLQASTEQVAKLMLEAALPDMGVLTTRRAHLSEEDKTCIYQLLGKGSFDTVVDCQGLFELGNELDQVSNYEFKVRLMPVEWRRDSNWHSSEDISLREPAWFGKAFHPYDPLVLARVERMYENVSAEIDSTAKVGARSVLGSGL
jgi:hypothetical protein